ncbi:MAG: hypothetical protein KC442_19625 [Thermomicrobiales bacterium]|nr:hypothetical protein [Thermomicrobiales bacterium]
MRPAEGPQARSLRSELTAEVRRALAVATSPAFTIRPSHARARLDVNRGVVEGWQRVLCGAVNGAGRWTCGDVLAHVGPQLVDPDWGELVMPPGMISAERWLPGGDPPLVWHPTGDRCWRLSGGWEVDRWRRPRRFPADDERWGEFGGDRLHTGTAAYWFPAVTICCQGHLNILDADALRVITEEDNRQAYLSLPIVATHAEWQAALAEVLAKRRKA